MTGHVQVGELANFSLRKGLLIYEAHDGDRTSGAVRSYVTEHPAHMRENGKPFLGAGSLLSQEFLTNLMNSLRGEQEMEVLPENVLVRGRDRIVWWIPCGMRSMFYLADRSPELVELNGKRLPQPALLFDVSGGQLSIFALKENKRPTKATKLYSAPYWNVDDRGSVCLGSTRIPDVLNVESIAGWTDSFFESQFTHQNASRPLTTHPSGFVALWRELIGKKVFPVMHLASADLTMGQYLKH